MPKPIAFEDLGRIKEGDVLYIPNGIKVRGVASKTNTPTVVFTDGLRIFLYFDGSNCSNRKEDVAPNGKEFDYIVSFQALISYGAQIFARTDISVNFSLKSKYSF